MKNIFDFIDESIADVGETGQTISWQEYTYCTDTIDMCIELKIDNRGKLELNTFSFACPVTGLELDESELLKGVTNELIYRYNENSTN